MNQTNRQTIWIVEDDPEICCLFSELLVDFDAYVVVCVEDARRVQANPGDVIFLDFHGTRAKFLNANGATVITMSGDSALMPSLQKPFDFKEVQKMLRARLQETIRAI